MPYKLLQMLKRIPHQYQLLPPKDFEFPQFLKTSAVEETEDQNTK